MVKLLLPEGHCGVGEWQFTGLASLAIYLLGGFDTRRGREWVHYEWSGGGNGGFAEADGPSAMAPFDWGDLVTVQPSEVIEARFPLLVEYSELDVDSGGAGLSSSPE